MVLVAAEIAPPVNRRTTEGAEVAPHPLRKPSPKGI